MMHVESSKMTEAVGSVWATLLGIEARPNPDELAGRIKPNILTGCIQITGAWQGAVMVECSGGLARRVASILFGADDCDISTDQVNDALGELTNIIGGNIKAMLPEPSHLSMPAVTEGTDDLFSVPGSRTMAQMAFTCEGKPFQITVLESHR